MISVTSQNVSRCAINQGASQSGVLPSKGARCPPAPPPPPPKRPSVRVTSKRTFDPKKLSGATGSVLFVLDLAHMPVGCGIWPAWWLNSALGSWPQYGEVDIVEVRCDDKQRTHARTHART
jgi:hypothetical protein|eukprot:SAG25_NODE_1122_length_3887_cov_2.126188_3_plen_121_part_00